MPFSYQQFEKSRLVWWNCKEIEPLPCKDLTTKSKACFRHLSSSSTNCNWKSLLFLLLKGKKANIFDFSTNRRVVSSVAGLNSVMLWRLLSHEAASPADGEVAATSSILPQYSRLPEAAVAHALQALYSTLGIHLHQQTQVRTQQWEGRELYANVKTKL